MTGQFDDLRYRHPLNTRCIRVGNDHIKTHRKTGVFNLDDADAAHFQQSCNGGWRSCCEGAVDSFKQDLIVTYKKSMDGLR